MSWEWMPVPRSINFAFEESHGTAFPAPSPNPISLPYCLQSTVSEWVQN